MTRMNFLAIVGFTTPDNNMALVEFHPFAEDAASAKSKARKQFRERFGYRHIETIEIIPIH